MSLRDFRDAPLFLRHLALPPKFDRDQFRMCIMCNCPLLPLDTNFNNIISNASFFFFFLRTRSIFLSVYVIALIYQFNLVETNFFLLLFAIKNKKQRRRAEKRSASRWIHLRRRFYVFRTPCTFRAYIVSSLLLLATRSIPLFSNSLFWFCFAFWRKGAVPFGNHRIRGGLLFDYRSYLFGLSPGVLFFG